MPFVEGESLRAKLARGGELPIADVVRILREVAIALAYAHGRGVVHRDMKPENVLLSEGTAMVSDFGVAKAIVEAGEAGAASLTSRGVALGTPAYMAPEQGMADPRTDQRADVYAFGVMAYEMLAGRTPFAGRSPQATLAAHVTEIPEPVERVRSSTPPALAALVMHCLAKSPADRPQNALALVHALDALVTPTEGTMRHAAASPEASVVVLGAPVPQEQVHGAAGPASRRRVRAIAIAAAILAVAAGGWFASKSLRVQPIVGRRIAVAPFKNETGDSSFDVVGRYAADVLTRELSRDESLDVVSTTAVTAAMAGIQSDADVVSLLARATRASIIVDGTIYAQGDSIRLQASITDVRAGKPFRTMDPVTAQRNAASTAIEALRDRILGAFEVDRTFWVMTRAPKLSAYSEFERAREFLFFRRDPVTARALLRRAIALDSTLFAAYGMLTAAYSDQSMWDSAEAVTAEWGRFQDRFSPDEREWFEYGTGNLAGDIERSLAAMQKLAVRDPSGLPAFLTGANANGALRARLALSSLLKSDSGFIAARQLWGYQVYELAEAYHLNADYAGELEMLHRRRKNYPNEPGLLARDLRALAALGRGTEASALADTLLRGTTDPNDEVITYAVNEAAMEFEAHGDSAAGAALARQVSEWHASHPTTTPSARRSIQHGVAWLTLGRLDSAQQAFAGAARDTSRLFRARGEDLNASGYLAVILAPQGQSARARAIADSLGRLQRKWLFGWNTFWRAAIYSELGDREVAVRVLGQAYKDGTRKQFWHYYLPLRSLRGYPPFEALIKPER